MSAGHERPAAGNRVQGRFECRYTYINKTICRTVHAVYQYSDYLSKVSCYPHRRLISKLEVAVMAYVLTLAALARVLNGAAGRKGSVLCVNLAQLKVSTIFCLTVLPACHTRSHYTKLFQHPQKLPFLLLSNRVCCAFILRHVLPTGLLY